MSKPFPIIENEFVSDSEINIEEEKSTTVEKGEKEKRRLSLSQQLSRAGSLSEMHDKVIGNFSLATHSSIMEETRSNYDNVSLGSQPYHYNLSQQNSLEISSNITDATDNPKSESVEADDKNSDIVETDMSEIKINVMEPEKENDNDKIKINNDQSFYMADKTDNDVIINNGNILHSTFADANSKYKKDLNDNEARSRDSHNSNQSRQTVNLFGKIIPRDKLILIVCLAITFCIAFASLLYVIFIHAGVAKIDS